MMNSHDQNIDTPPTRKGLNTPISWC